MSTLLLERSPLLQASDEVKRHEERYEDALFARPVAHGGLTLDELITSVWEGLAVRDVVSCPVCAGAMKLECGDESDGSPTAVCLDCGSRLS